MQALAWRLAQLAKHKAGLVVFIAPDLKSYRRLAEELATLLPDPAQLMRFPPWEVLPYDRASPHPEIVGERLHTLARLARGGLQGGILLTALPAWLQRIAPPEAVAASVWRVEEGDRLDLARLREQLVAAGMEPAERVVFPGTFAVRGGVLDVWPPNEPAPLRLELWDDEVVAIRRFDPDTQRTTEKVPRLISAPARETLLSPERAKEAHARFIQRFPQHRKHPIAKALAEGRHAPGLEQLLPLVFARTARLRDYLPEHARILAPEDMDEARRRFREQLFQQFEIARATGEPALAPEELYAIEGREPWEALAPDPAIGAPPSAQTMQGARPVAALVAELKARLQQGWRLVAVAHGPGQAERMRETLSAFGLSLAEGAFPKRLPEPGTAELVLGWLEEGFADATARLLVLTGREVLGQRLPRKRARRRTWHEALESLAELSEGMPVVHEVHGVGRFVGLETIADDTGLHDFIKLAYADAEVLVPVEEIGRLHRYVGAEEPPLDRLRSARFRRARERAKRDLLAMAHELIAMEAARREVRRAPYRLDGEVAQRFAEFVARFPFEETEDQAEAIRAVIRDMTEKGAPMDRIICGDVGFGKTEVALRAAAIAAFNGRQVAVLAPTTVLASQHEQKFRDRFAGTGIEVVALTRLEDTAARRKALTKIAEGAPLIVIGTHRLLGEDVRFARLGLIVVDEEQRFGVRQKTKLAAQHPEADLLTLSATPIPRTLHQTLAGLRDVSVIATPPEGREAIRTIVTSFDAALAHEAIRRELYRGGQVYYVHNRVRSIARIAARIREEIPEASVGIAHGQMNPAALERAMMDFYEGRTNVLVCTTIVESGLDVPNANTLIVERADLLGLAQLHQIRGRVGRSGAQAFAYFFTPPPEAMTKQARERLAVIAEHSELGAGFWIARRDMEIRGAGNLLGPEQSGHIEEVGLDLYLELLQEALAEARGQAPRASASAEVRLGLPAHIPADYVPQAGERVVLYRRLARARHERALEALWDELHDRFGPPPAEVRALWQAARVRLLAEALRIAAVHWTGKGFRIVFTPESPIDAGALILRVQKEPARFRLSPDGALVLRTDASPADAVDALMHFLRELLAQAPAEAAA